MFSGDWTISGLPSMQKAEIRLRTARRFLRVMESAVTEQTQVPWDAVDSMIDPPRNEPSAAPDEQAIRYWEEARAELPLLAWATTLAYCFSTLEAFLHEAAEDAARMRGATVRLPRGGPLVEAWLAELQRLGVSVRRDARTMDDLGALRRVRNALVHGTALTKAQVPPDLRGCFEESPAFWATPGSLVPMSELVRRALAIVEAVVAAVDYAVAVSAQQQVERWDPLHRAWATRSPE